MKLVMGLIVCWISVGNAMDNNQDLRRPNQNGALIAGVAGATHNPTNESIPGNAGGIPMDISYNERLHDTSYSNTCFGFFMNKFVKWRQDKQN